jgi:phage/plasmid-associated DNA primase
MSHEKLNLLKGNSDFKPFRLGQIFADKSKSYQVDYNTKNYFQLSDCNPSSTPLMASLVWMNVEDKSLVVPAICVDVDAHKGENLAALVASVLPTVETFVGAKLDSNLEYSINGCHIWMVLESLMPAKAVFDGIVKPLQELLADIEVYPMTCKNTTRCIRVPGRYKDGVSYSTDKDGKPILDHSDFLSKCVIPGLCSKVIEKIEPSGRKTKANQIAKQLVSKKGKIMTISSIDHIFNAYDDIELFNTVFQDYFTPSSKAIICPFHADTDPSFIFNINGHNKIAGSCMSPNCSSHFSGENNSLRILEMIALKLGVVSNSNGDKGDFQRRLVLPETIEKINNLLLGLCTGRVGALYPGLIDPEGGYIESNLYAVRERILSSHLVYCEEDKRYYYRSFDNDSPLWKETELDLNSTIKSLLTSAFKDVIYGDILRKKLGGSKVFLAGCENGRIKSVTRMNDIFGTYLMPTNLGVLDLLHYFETGEKHFIDITPDLYLTYYIENVGDEVEDNGVFKKFLETVITRPDHREYFLKYVASCFITKEWDFNNKIPLLLGSGGNGKSTLLNAITGALSGISQSFNVKELESGFGLDTISNKQFICDPDVTSEQLTPNIVSLLKKVSGGDLLEINAKHKKAFNKTIRTRMVLSVNNLLSNTAKDDNSVALHRRLIYLLCDANVLTDGEIGFNQSFLNTKKTREAIIETLLVSLKELYNSKFSLPEIDTKEVDKEVVSNNPIMEFLNENIFSLSVEELHETVTDETVSKSGSLVEAREKIWKVKEVNDKSVSISTPVEYLFAFFQQTRKQSDRFTIKRFKETLKSYLRNYNSDSNYSASILELQNYKNLDSSVTTRKRGDLLVVILPEGYREFEQKLFEEKLKKSKNL